MKAARQQAIIDLPVSHISLTTEGLAVELHVSNMVSDSAAVQAG